MPVMQEQEINPVNCISGNDEQDDNFQCYAPLFLEELGIGQSFSFFCGQ